MPPVETFIRPPFRLALTRRSPLLSSTMPVPDHCVRKSAVRGSVFGPAAVVLVTVPTDVLRRTARPTSVRRSIVEAEVTVRLPAARRVSLLKMAPPVPGAMSSLLLSDALTRGVPGAAMALVRRSMARETVVTLPAASVAVTVMVLPAPMPSARKSASVNV